MFPAVPMQLVTRDDYENLPVCDHCHEQMIWLCALCERKFRVGDFYCLVPLDASGVGCAVCLDCTAP